jgi:uncharacterized membrane protein
MHINTTGFFGPEDRLISAALEGAGNGNLDTGMDVSIEKLPGFEAATSSWIHLVGICIEVFGVFIIVVGIAWSTLLCVNWRNHPRSYDAYKIRIGRSLLLGLEVLVAADIVKTIAIELTFTSLGLLAGLVVVRTFLSWTLVLEIEGRWPWKSEPRVESDPQRAKTAAP